MGGASAYAMVSEETTSEQQQNEENTESKIDPKGIIFEHLGDRYGWEVPFAHHYSIPLPIIVRDYKGDWHIFSSARLEHGKEYDGFYIAGEDSPYKGKIVGVNPEKTGEEAIYRPFDISITKNVAALLICALVVVWMVFSVRGYYRKNPKKAPRKVKGMFELIVEFVYTGVIRPTLGDKSKRFAPFLLTVFFFILVMNLLGLVVIFPGGANLTGNIAVTLVLAIMTFIFTNIRATKHYWKEILWPDVPMFLKFPLPIMQVIEIFGMFTKPAALTVRLFANMMGGHMIVITLTLLIFIFAAFGAVAAGGSLVMSLAFSLFMLLLDVLVSFIQAYVFTMLSTIFIALSHEDGHEEHKIKEEETKRIEAEQKAVENAI
ncbi:MAG: F0F1 ATP synthase subunit A [Muribaculaceae bacterium]|nr:F0F1 ATP synthase subunit A [Muribaculaceae bacterium]